jgi:hypothetical protein
MCTTLIVPTVWRTSTAEPTRDGIIWTYTKDVTRYIPVFAKSGVFNMGEYFVPLPYTLSLHHNPNDLGQYVREGQVRPRSG